MTDQALNDPSGDVFARLAAIPVPVMTDYLVIELPQTVAAILLLLPQERAAAILKGPAAARLPERRAPDGQKRGNVSRGADHPREGPRA